jgi:hypothetical protein
MTSLLVALTVLAGEPALSPHENRPPQFHDATDTWGCQVGVTCTLDIDVTDADGDPLTLTTTPLPAGATLLPNGTGGEYDSNAKGSQKRLALQLKATADQTGEYPVTITASDGITTTTHDVTIEVTQEWEVYAMPGLSALSYDPRQLADTGGYAGASVECLIASWAHRNNKHGPSHGRVYVDLDLLFPLSGHGGNMYAYTAGADLTIERNPSRRFLLPYFGAEVGGIHSAALGDYFVAIPYGGVHVWADRNVWVDVSGGYVLPGRNLDQLSGAWTKAGLDMSFW